MKVRNRKNGRSRMGCWTCRRSHRKCDETKPVCKNCTQRGTKCDGYAVLLGDFSARPGFQGQMVGKLQPPAVADAQRQRTEANSMTSVETDDSIKLHSTTSSEPVVDSADDQNIAKGTGRLLGSVATNANDMSCFDDQSVLKHVLYPNSAHGEIYQTSPPTPRLAVSFLVDKTCNNWPSDDWHQSLHNPPRIGDSKHVHVETQDLIDQLFPREQDERQRKYGDEQEHREEESLQGASRDLYESLRDVDLSTIWASCTDPALSSAAMSALSQNGISFTTHKQRVGEEVDDMLTASFEKQSSWSLLHPSQIFNRHTHPYLLSSPFERYLFKHFSETVARQLNATDHEYNPYRSIYGALSVESPMLINTILAISSLHLTHIGQLPTGSSRQYRQKAVSMLRDTLSRPDHILQDSTLAAVLLNILYEGIGAGISGWSVHLKGAKSLVRLRGTSAKGEVSRMSPFLHLHCKWMCTLASTIMDDDAVSYNGYNDLDDNTYDGNDMSRLSDDGVMIYDPEQFYAHDAETYLSPESILTQSSKSMISASGPTSRVSVSSSTNDKSLESVNCMYFADLPSHSICSFIQITVDLSTQLRRDNSRDTLHSLLPSIMETLTNMRDWKVPISNPADQLVQQTNEFWRQGALCHFYQAIWGLGPDDSQMQECVEVAFKTLCTMPSAGGGLRTVFWPLFMIGVEMIRTEHRQLLETMMIETSKETGIHSFLGALMVIKEAWRNHDIGGQKQSTWREVISRSGWELMLLI